MLINYSHSGSVASAFEKTFDGRHPCPLCNAIRKGEQQQGGKKQDYQAGGKIDMDCMKPARSFIPPMRDFSWPAFLAGGSGFAPEPVVPPPRAA
jgi:hypothetical protein